MIYRTYNCGEINKDIINNKVILCGWIFRIIKFKYIYIIYIYDFYKKIKLILNKKNIFFSKKKNVIKKGYLLRIKGIVKKDKNIKKNKKYQLEILVNKIFILNKSLLLPINIYNNIYDSSLFSIKYKYLLFRNKYFKKIFKLKNYMLYKIRNYLYKKKFLEIDTPIISEYLSISGSKVLNILINKFKMELSQSPQIFKQLLMIGGIDKYYQIAKCFRNEKHRNNRLIEFNQIDFEFSFIKKKNILNFSEKFIKYIFNNIFHKKLSNFKLFNYKTIIKKYGTDKPNLFFNIKIKYFYINKKKKIYFIIKKKYKLSIKKIINIINKCNKLNKYKFFYIYKNKFINCIYNKKFIKKKIIGFKKKNIYIILYNIFNNDKKYFKMGEIINEIINKLIKNKIFYNKYYPVWIINFPLFKKKNKKIYSYHHPFTSPINNNNIKINSISNSYDLIINGLEIASGSIRINKYKIQKKILNLLFNDKKKIKKYFNFFLKALKFGAPPHGGIAFGLERILSLIFNKNIINMIAFPKKKYEKK